VISAQRDLIWGASGLIVETPSGPNVSNSCAKKTSALLCVYLQCLAAPDQPASNIADAPFVGKSSRSNAQHGALLCGAGHWQKAWLKRRFSVSCRFRGQIDAGSWLSIGALHNG
jgi:hypothetical protein